MEIVSLNKGHFANSGTSIALGMFDGVHIGHRRIITAAKNKSTELGISSSVLIFSRSPHGAKELLPLCDRLEEIKKLGINYAFVYDFEELKDKTPSEFVEEELCKKLSAVAISAGDTEALSRLAEKCGAECGIADKITALGEGVSSSRIRDLLKAGDIESANTLLGYPYYLSASVLHGKALGRAIGIPTINQAFDENGVEMAGGIYYTKTVIDKRSYPSVSNVGVRPTVEKNGRKNLETHLSFKVFSFNLQTLCDHCLRDLLERCNIVTGDQVITQTVGFSCRGRGIVDVAHNAAQALIDLLARPAVAQTVLHHLQRGNRHTAAA